MKVLIFQTGEPFKTDGNAYREMRAGVLSDWLISSGHSCEVWSSTFFHQEKRQRYTADTKFKMENGCSFRFIRSPGYSKNVSLARFWDHLVLGIRTYNQLITEYDETDLPDAVYIGFPPIEFAFFVSRWAKKRRIRTVICLEDQWPDLFVSYFPKSIRWLARIAFYPYTFLLRKTLANVDVVSGVSESYLDWGFRVARRERGSEDFVFSLVSDYPAVSVSEETEAERFWTRNGVDAAGSEKIVFVGTLSRGFKFHGVAEAVRLLRQAGRSNEVVIAGTGERELEVRNLFKGIDGVFFPGWINFPQYKWLLDRAGIALAPYDDVENFSQNIPNKLVDAVWANVPIVTAVGDGEMASFVSENNIGMHLSYNTAEEWFGAFERILGDPELKSTMVANAQSVYESKFSAQELKDLCLSAILPAKL